MTKAINHLPPTEGPWYVDGWSIYAKAAEDPEINPHGHIAASSGNGFENAYTALSNLELMAQAPALKARVTELEDKVKPAFEMAAKQIRLAAHAAFTSSFCFNQNPLQKQISDRMKNPAIGDFVWEISTIYQPGLHYKAVGILKNIAKEPAFEDWDEEAEGEPCPLEKVVYIETLGGVEVRWVNCEFFRVPEYEP